MSPKFSVNGSCSSVSNVLDSNPDTRVSFKGLGSYFDANLEEKDRVAGIAIAFFAGDRRKIKFTVASDGKVIQTFASSGETLSPEVFMFNKPVTTQSLRVSFAGNYEKGVTFDKNALSTFPSDTPFFKNGIAVTGLRENKGMDDGRAGNDWFSVTMVDIIFSDDDDENDFEAETSSKPRVKETDKEKDKVIKPQSQDDENDNLNKTLIKGKIATATTTNK